MTSVCYSTTWLLLRCQIHNRCILLSKITEQASDLCPESTGGLVPGWGQATCGTVKLAISCLVWTIESGFLYAIYVCCCVLHVLFVRSFVVFTIHPYAWNNVRLH